LISDEDLDVLLRERDPLDQPAWNARQVEPLLTRLAREISSSPDLGLAPRRDRRLRRRVVTVAAARVMVAAAALAGFGVFGDGVTTQSLLPGTQLPAAQAAELNRIAATAARGPSAGRGKWLYLKVLTIEHEGLQIRDSPVLFYSLHEAVQMWGASASGPTRMRVTFSNFSFASAHARSVYESHHAIWANALAALPLPPKRTAVANAVFQRDATVSPTAIGDGNASKVPLSSLPSNPEALVGLLGREHLKGFHAGSAQLKAGQRKQQQSFISDNQALGDWIALSQILIASTSARQRAEAYRALTLVPFVRVVGKRRDSRGRLGPR
jgi:hypothetical protein